MHPCAETGCPTLQGAPTTMAVECQGTNTARDCTARGVGQEGMMGRPATGNGQRTTGNGRRASAKSAGEKTESVGPVDQYTEKAARLNHFASRPPAPAAKRTDDVHGTVERNSPCGVGKPNIASLSRPSDLASNPSAEVNSHVARNSKVKRGRTTRGARLELVSVDRTGRAATTGSRKASPQPR